MKTKLVILGLAFTFLAASGALAAEKSKERKAAKPATAGKTEKQKQSARDADAALTGSYIKQTVRRQGMVTDAVSPVLVIDSEAIKNSGASDLRQLLVRTGMTR